MYNMIINFFIQTLPFLLSRSSRRYEYLWFDKTIRSLKYRMNHYNHSSFNAFSIVTITTVTIDDTASFYSGKNIYGAIAKVQYSTFDNRYDRVGNYFTALGRNHGYVRCVLSWFGLHATKEQTQTPLK